MYTKKVFISGLLILMSLIVLLFVLNAVNQANEIIEEDIVTPKDEEGIKTLPTDTKNITFTISGERIALQNGVVEIPIIEGSASVRTVRYFGNEVEQDIDGDGDLDKVFLVIDNPGGSGTFFYVVGAINEGNGYSGTEAMLLGDRIAPQTTEAGENGLVLVNYADRAPGEPMNAIPTIGKSMWVKYETKTNSFGEVVQDFEGESASNAKDKINLIRLSEPTEGSTLSSPIKLSGEARGYWFFEASFPITVVDWDGLIIGEGYATAEGDWMTEEFVPFTATVTYSLPANTPYKRGAIILQKDNPSGLPENDDALEIPVMLE
jgi:hypothetical protein